MTKFQLTVSGGWPSLPADYPTLGFIVTTNGAILDGSLSTPPITLPPDARWAVYGGGSAETGITRYAQPTITPTPESPNGYMLAYSDSQNTYVSTSPAALIQTPSWVAALDAAFFRIAVKPSGDTSGTTDRAALVAAIATVSGGNGGTVQMVSGIYYINGARVVVPEKVNLCGQGGGALFPATKIVCTASASGISFGTRTDGGFGGESGRFTVDGNWVANNPIYVGLAVNRTFTDMHAVSANTIGIKLQNTQNCGFFGCSSFGAVQSNLSITDGASNNHFFKFEPGSSDAVHVHFTLTGDPLDPTLPAFPYDNHVHAGISEYDSKGGPGVGTSTATKGVWQEYGDANGIHQFNLATDGHLTGYALVQVDQGSFYVDGGWFTGNVIPFKATAFKVASGCRLNVCGAPSINGVDKVFDSAGQVYIDGFLRLNGYTTYSTGAGSGFFEKLRYDSAIVGNVPVATNLGQALTTSNAVAGTAWWKLDPAQYPTPDTGRVLQYRLRAIVQGATAADSLVVQMLDTDGVGPNTAIVAAASAAGVDTLASTWVNFPTSGTYYGYVVTRNATAARGVLVSAWIEVRIA